ncbi:MAG TPA: N(4)-(beta-N-acetylglucosaminyl)-L-asparaginase [Gemmatimonadaceae bacterium]|nr:N(4)-(beta-N-acetylglucosaminyl)-L-asparaginase [Gemmatimonadaceae bacterium]
MSISRRDFLGAGVTATAGLALARPTDAAPAVSGMLGRSLSILADNRPAVVSSANGIRGVARAREMMVQGADPLDAAIAGVNITELDPKDHSVGLGGLPNEDGVVQLDASCMHGPTRRAGAVGAIEDIATPSLVAKAVMDYTDHIFLVGAGAKKFALEMGFKEQNLLTDEARQIWLKWKANHDPNDAWLDHDDDVKIQFTHGTINMNAVTAGGDIGSVTTTSGMSYKIPGRVGDSAIVGAGQYCDNDVGAAGSTGRGEANIKIAGAFFVIEQMRGGASPEEACLRALQRAIQMTETRLLDEHKRPRYDLTYYAIAKDGRYGSANIYAGLQYAVADARGARLESCAYLFKESERPSGPVPMHALSH